MAESVWKPEGDPRAVAGAEVQYLRGAHSHEGAHQVTVGDAGTLTVYPDGTTSSRRRVGVIRTALGETEGAADGYRMRHLVGTLVTNGATHLYLHGEPLFGTNVTGAGKWRLELADDGRVAATWIGGST